MTQLELLLTPYIKGSHKQWFCQFTVGSVEIAGGYFTSKQTLRRYMVTRLRFIFTDDSVLREFLIQRKALEEWNKRYQTEIEELGL